MAASKSLLAAAVVLKAGEPAIVPTDTVYGLAVAPAYCPSPDVLYTLKDRPSSKPIAWLIADAGDLAVYGRAVPDFAFVLARTFWPGPLTLVVKASDGVPSPFRSAEGTIGLRIPADEAVRSLIRRIGSPLCTTSANPAGAKPPRSFAAIDPALAARVGAAFDDDAEKSGISSTVLDCSDDHPVMIREGAVTVADIKALS